MGWDESVLAALLKLEGQTVDKFKVRYGVHNNIVSMVLILSGPDRSGDVVIFGCADERTELKGTFVPGTPKSKEVVGQGEGYEIIKERA